MISRRFADQPHVHHLCVHLVLHNTSVARLPWYELRVMAGLSPLIFSGRLLLRANLLDDIDHVSVTHVFLDVFIYNLIAPSHYLDPIHILPCFMLHAHVILSYPLFWIWCPFRTPLHCCTFFVSLIFEDFWFFFLLFCDGKTFWISLFLHLLEGVFFYPPSFSFLFLSTTYLSPCSWNLLPTSTTPFFPFLHCVFILSFIITLLKNILFFCAVFN